MSWTRAAALIALAGCAPEPAVSGGALGPTDQGGPPLTLQVTDAVILGTMTLDVAGADSRETIYVGRSMTGAGAGPCWPSIGGQCWGILDDIALHAVVNTNASGAKTVQMALGDWPFLDGEEACFQAVAIRGGASILSNTVCIDIGYDEDLDGILDQFDACPLGPNRYDWDGDGIFDPCDPNGAAPQYDTAEYTPHLQQTSFQGRSVRYHVPANPVGIVFAFHGSGGDHTVSENPELTVMLQELIDRGYGVIIPQSQNQGAGTWDTASSMANNSDWKRWRDARAALIGAGVFDASTPIYALGFSNGGYFASYFGHAALQAGWPIAALALHQAAGNTSQFGSTPDLPTIFHPADNDLSVDPAVVEGRYNDHIAAGHPGLLLPFTAQRFAPTRFARSAFIGVAKSETLWGLMVDAGYYDDRGFRQFAAGQIPTVVQDIPNLPDFSPDAPARAVLNIVLATHAWNAQHAVADANYFDAQR